MCKILVPFLFWGIVLQSVHAQMVKGVAVFFNAEKNAARMYFQDHDTSITFEIRNTDVTKFRFGKAVLNAYGKKGGESYDRTAGRMLTNRRVIIVSPVNNGRSIVIPIANFTADTSINLLSVSIARERTSGSSTPAAQSMLRPAYFEFVRSTAPE